MIVVSAGCARQIRLEIQAGREKCASNKNLTTGVGCDTLRLTVKFAYIGRTLCTGKFAYFAETLRTDVVRLESRNMFFRKTILNEFFVEI